MIFRLVVRAYLEEESVFFCEHYFVALHNALHCIVLHFVDTMAAVIKRQLYVP